MTKDLYVPSDIFERHNTFDTISEWTKKNLMQLNPDKCYYMIFSRSGVDFATRLSVNNRIIEQKQEFKK